MLAASIMRAASQGPRRPRAASTRTGASRRRISSRRRLCSPSVSRIVSYPGRMRPARSATTPTRRHVSANDWPGRSNVSAARRRRSSTRGEIGTTVVIVSSGRRADAPEERRISAKEGLVTISHKLVSSARDNRLVREAPSGIREAPSRIPKRRAGLPAHGLAPPRRRRPCARRGRSRRPLDSRLPRPGPRPRRAPRGT